VRSIPSSKASYPQTARKCLLFSDSSIFSFSLMSSNSFLLLLPRLPAPSSLPFIFPSITCFRKQFLRKMRPIQLTFFLFTLCRIFLSFFTLAVLLHFSHDRSNSSSPSFSSTKFQNFPGISDLPSEVSKFQHHTKLLEIDKNNLLRRQTPGTLFIPYPTAFPYGNGMVLHFYQQQESSTTKTEHKVINKGLKTYV